MTDRDYRKRYNEIMCDAERRKRALNRLARGRERALRDLMDLRRRRARESQAAANQRLIEGIESEIAKLLAKLGSARGQKDRIFLKAEIEHLRALKQTLIRNGRRKPPEAGIAVPAVPPEGPLPKQGGAEAPLDFGE